MHRRKFLSQGLLTTLGIVSLPSLQADEASGFANNTLADPGVKEIIAEIEKLVPGLMKEAHVPALSIALIHDGLPAWSRGFGVSDFNSSKPVNADTVYECASISKTVFAYAIMKLCEQGVMDLDTPLIKYRSQAIVDDPRAAQITARHVLSHQSGLQNWRTFEEPLKIHFDPGKGFMYSGEGYFYLQSIGTHLRGKSDSTQCSTYEAGLKVCGTDIGEYLEQQVLLPLGMTSSGYRSNEKLRNNFALPHDQEGKVISKPPPSGSDLARYAAAGGLLTTANDYARFITTLFEPKDNHRYRLNRKSIDEMHKPQVKLPPDQKIDGATAWGLGWAVQERPGGNVVLHSGGQPGYRSLMMISMQRKSGFVMFTNSDNGGYVLYTETLGKVLNELLPVG